MSANTLIESRLSAVEAAVAELQRRLGSESQPSNWLERFTGAFKDEPAFAEVVAYGKALRSADAPRESEGH